MSFFWATAACCISERKRNQDGGEGEREGEDDFGACQDDDEHRAQPKSNVRFGITDNNYPRAETSES